MNPSSSSTFNEPQNVPPMIGARSSALQPRADRIGTEESGLAKFPWFAIRVKPKHEKTASAAVEAKGYESFLPIYLSRRKYGERFKNFHLPLFAGYFFACFNPDNRLPILMTDSILSILGNGRELITVPDEEIAALQLAVRSKLAICAHPFLKVGDRVRLAEGPLQGSEGILVRSKGHDHLVVSVTILQRSVSIQIDRAWARPLAS